MQESPYQLKDGDNIDTGSIYHMNDTLSYGEEMYKSILYLRFFGNGRFYKSSIDLNQKTNLKELDNPTFIGYYSITEGNQITY